MKPNLIFIIGPSCSGKSSMSKSICRLYPEYSVLDDAVPLYNIFAADTLLHQNKLSEFWEFAKANAIETYYDKDDPCFYSHPNPEGGFVIDNPIVWNIILTILGKQINTDYSIIEFSRGNDVKYNQFFDITNQEVYPISFNCLCKNIPTSVLKKSLIINIDAPLDIRCKRNINRYKNGGHLVSENTMNTIYEKDIFNTSNSYINIKKVKIPVVHIENQNDCADFSLFLQNEFVKALNCYRRYHNELQ